MTPFYFGDRDRRLFGLYTPARAGAGPPRAVVLCHPWGQEYLRAHRSVRQLATQLADAGVHVLRFDYFGTGDSAGEMHQANLERWEADIGQAIEELKDSSGIGRVGLIGLRLGAILAARVAPKHRKDVDSVVLWDPVVEGAEYLEELYEHARQIGPYGMVRRDPGDNGGGHEILGFRMTDAMAAAIGSIDLIKHLDGLPARSLVIASHPLRSHARLSAEAAGRTLALERVPALPVWLERRDFGAGLIPVNVLQRIVEWHS